MIVLSHFSSSVNGEHQGSLSPIKSALKEVNSDFLGEHQTARHGLLRVGRWADARSMEPMASIDDVSHALCSLASVH